MKDYIDPGFIHDLASLDRLRSGINNDDSSALRSAAVQFEAIFTNMLFKSMRDANSVFESDLTDNRQRQFFEQMHDEQMSSELSASGSLGLADLIVEQLGGAQAENIASHRPQTELYPAGLDVAIKQATASVPIDRDTIEQTQQRALTELQARAAMQQALDLREQTSSAATPIAAMENKPFDSPDNFVARLRPYAEHAASALGTDPAVLLAQAALETGWGQKVINNARGSSHNLFNIKANSTWQGDKMATNTLEFYDGLPVQENASFRSYQTYQDSFNDYVDFLKNNPRYQRALQHPENPNEFIRGLHQAGYATDPQYADKVISVMRRVNQILD
ncbi:flagellar assembly peptidoglycan hydrolase FlgJ [Thaumasiovibrio sp. DFM-14]|uniref:flagellar assembly peptidoglycan hydrolase FlgJ n=1 Tax=Thaumasiovibrio sp. DFM-14 TaxID=3384792 RepID=UPI0039A22146